MCGFLVELPFDTYPQTSQEQFKALLALSKHRGPDNSHIEATHDYQLIVKFKQKTLKCEGGVLFEVAQKLKV